jgi:hypothetical protein
MLTKALNEAAPVGNNPFQSLRCAPTNVDVAIHNIPTFAIPQDKNELTTTMSEAILFAADIQISNARYLKPNPADRAEKKTTSIVISCSPSDAKKIGSSIRLFSRPRKANIMWSANSATQCKKSWAFGHATQGCRQTESFCPLCTGNHSRSEHRCPIPTCPKGGNLKVIPNCCESSSPTCRNCLKNHPATDLECPVRKSALESAKARQNKTSDLDNEGDVTINN